MALLSLTLVVAVVVCIAISKYIETSRKAAATRRGKPLPGPKGLPLIGSILSLPSKCSWMKFHHWSLQYGPIYQVNLAGTNHVWIARDRIAKDLLSKRSAIYSDRPYIPALEHDNRDSGQYLPLMSRNDKWHRQRRFGKQIMDQSAREKYYGYPELESIRLLFELMISPEKYNHAMETFVARVTSRLAWGTPAPAEELKQRARELLIGVSPTGALGNKLPLVMALPEWMSPAKKWEMRRGRTEKKFFEMMQEEVKVGGGEGREKSWMGMFLAQKENWKFASDLEGSYAVGMHGIAGALTIAAPMQSFCLAMVHYPQYQCLLHEEIDRVVGDRMPRLEDMPDMPVLRAFIRETLRWRPPVPTGIPHALIEDDVYDGYFIPKGSVIHPLEWSISRDPEVFPEPDEWNPLRWLKEEYPTYQEPLSKFPTITEYSQFGYGRRVCQGMGVAEADLFVGIGSVAWLFSMHAVDETSYATNPEPALRRESDASATSNDSGLEILESSTKLTQHDNDSAVDLEYAAEPTLRTMGPGQDAPITEAGPDTNNVETHNGIPGEWNDAAETQVLRGELPEPKPSSYEDDPTMQFSTLLIAKPLPFKFQFRIRNHERAQTVARRWIEKKMEGEYEESRVYWEGGNQGDEEFGWGEVFA